MAITETGVVVTTLQGIQRTYTEQGQALQIVMDGLTPNTAYQATAYCIDNGIQSTSNTESFTTLVAGTIALTRQSMARQGSDYVIVYTYTSTYALSSSVLRVGSTAAAQGVIAGNSITFTISGLTPGDAYIYDVTSIDIYTETDNFQSSFVMPVVNTINITSTDPSDTAVEVELEYTVDGGFYEGFVSCWGENQDPDTDPSLIHWAFSNGADIVNCNNLTAGTTYKFRAEIVLGDMTTKISSSVVTVTTEADVDYLFIRNTSSSNNETIKIQRNGSPTTGTDLSYSRDKINWTQITYSSNIASISIPLGEQIYLRSTTGFSQSSSNYYRIYEANSRPFRAGGNIFSIIDYTNIDTLATIPNYGCYSMFSGSTITRAEVLENVVTINDYGCCCMFNQSNLSGFGNPQRIRTVKTHGCDLMFSGTKITSAINLNGVTSAWPHAFYQMHKSCLNLTTASNLNGLTEINPYTCAYMYEGCSLIVDPPEMNNVTIIRNDGMAYMFSQCSSLTKGVNLKSVTSIDFNSGTTTAGLLGSCYRLCTSITEAYAPNISDLSDVNILKNWLYGASSTGRAYKKSNATFISGSNGLPTGWTSENYS